MPSLPIATDFTGAGVTEAGFKTAITNQREFLAGLLGTTGNQIDALVALGALGADTVTKTGAYTVVAADRGKAILCSGTFTLSLTAAATLGDGFSFLVKNTGSGTITIDPNSTEQIDGSSTKTLAANEWVIVTCTGTAFTTFGYSIPAVPSVNLEMIGVINPNGGNSVSLTGLTLTNYEFLFVTINNIKPATSGSSGIFFSSNNNQTSVNIFPSVTSTADNNAIFTVGLADGWVYGTNRSSNASGSFSAGSNVTSSSTAIYFRISGTTNYSAQGRICIFGGK